MNSFSAAALLSRDTLAALAQASHTDPVPCSLD